MKNQHKFKYVAILVSLMITQQVGALTSYECAALYPNSHCQSFSADEQANLCVCTQCEDYYPARGGNTSINGILFPILCGCISDGSCSSNPDTSRRCGTYSCKLNKADYSTCYKCPDTDSNYEYCTSNAGSDNQCRQFKYTSDGYVFCGTGNTCSIAAPGVQASTMVSAYCSEYKGVASLSKCAVMGCSTGWTPSGDRSQCVCAQGYYRSGNNCLVCPSYNGTPGTTSGSGATSINECFVPLDTPFFDNTGTFIYSTFCYYE